MGKNGWERLDGLNGWEWLDKQEWLEKIEQIRKNQMEGLDGQQVQKLNYLEHELLTTLKK